MSILTMFCAALYRDNLRFSRRVIKFYVLRTVYCHMRILWSTHASMRRIVESDRLRSSPRSPPPGAPAPPAARDRASRGGRACAPRGSAVAGAVFFLLRW